jgi:haloacetate dehalogenase
VLNKTPEALAPEAVSEYHRCFRCTSVAPVHVLWGAKGTVGTLLDGLATWRAKAASTVTWRGLDFGHPQQVERPEETFQELQHLFDTM